MENVETAPDDVSDSDGYVMQIQQMDFVINPVISPRILSAMTLIHLQLRSLTL